MSCLQDSWVQPPQVIKAYEHRAESYSQRAVVQRKLAAWLAEWIEDSSNRDNLEALEFGAGDGIFTRILTRCFCRLTATDLSPKMVQQGRRRLPKIDWHVADAWNYAGDTVDRLYSASLLQWCPDPERVLREWRDTAKRGARMLHGFYVAPTLPEWYSISSNRSPLEWRSPHEWECMVREAGWSLLRSESRACKQEFPSGLDFIRFLRHTGATCRGTSSIAELREMIADYERGFPAHDGGITSTWTFFRLEAENW
jgi:SAM-dependent methyltransferase